MNVADLADKIRDRAAADTGSGGLFETLSPLISAFYYAAIPNAAVMPYCVFMVSADQDQSMFTQNMSMVQFRVVTFVQRTTLTTGTQDPVLTGSKILKRVYGDSASGSLTPSYGFHRFSPTLTDWTATSIMYQNTNENHGDEYYSWSQEFRLWLTK